MRRVTMLAVLVLTSIAGAQVTVVSIDGRSFEGTLSALDGAQVAITGTDQQSQVVPMSELEEIRWVEPAGDILAQPGQAVLTTVRAGRLAATKIGPLVDGRLGVESALTGQAGIALEQVAQMLWPEGKLSSGELSERLDRLAAASAEDVLFARVVQPASTQPTLGAVAPSPQAQAELMPIIGALVSLTDSQVTFSYQGQERQMDRSRVAAIRPGRADGPVKTPGGYVFGRDGSRLDFDTVSLKGDGLQLTGTPLGELALPVEGVAAIRFRNPNIVYLSGPMQKDEPAPDSGILPASLAEQKGTFDAIFPPRTNLSVAGKSIRLDGVTYDRGLGLHSRTRLVWQLDGQFRTLLARVGIDDSVRPRGQASLSVSLDGRPAMKSLTLSGQENSQAIRLDVSGAKELTIIVDFGEGLDVADHVDLAEARLIR